MAVRELTPKQQRFVEEYLIDLNATAAYKRAGYVATGNAAEVNAARLLRNAKVAEAIAAAGAERAHRCEVTADRVLAELAALAFSDIGQLVLFTADGIRFRQEANIPEAARRAVASVKVRRDLGGENRPPAEMVEFRLWPKAEPLKMLGQHLGLWKALEGLEALLVLLPPDFARAVRQALAASLPGDGGEASRDG